ncbi:hypothetical protein [Streptomyces sp. S.PB5]|uniref:hypothetical protein n=1 Tax=Streptomyces sp. S.PB5 TaxID=3020844 RepID=UPI0025B278EC|nr:hypothetical protein [Streptomyces sp. S.PB5]MDN3020977.1 hypothetical protein [Streptomyces sp. S.PB5]
MSRTAHHVPYRHRTLPAFWPLGRPGPWTGNTVEELRYSHEELNLAGREGRRPVPTLVVRNFTSYTFPRATNERPYSPYERRARAALQVFRTSARRHLRSALTGALPLWAEELDHPPTRHRHSDLWDA